MRPEVTLGSAYNTCPEGESFEGFIDPLAAAHTEDVSGDSTLMVSGNGKTVALPNTPGHGRSLIEHEHLTSHRTTQPCRRSYARFAGGSASACDGTLALNGIEGRSPRPGDVRDQRDETERTGPGGQSEWSSTSSIAPDFVMARSASYLQIEERGSRRADAGKAPEPSLRGLPDSHVPSLRTGASGEDAGGIGAVSHCKEREHC